MPVPMIEVPLNGKWPLLLPEHRAARPQWRTGWETERLDSLHANISPGDIVFDIGTEEGDMSALMCSWGAQMVLFEPNPRVWPNPRSIWAANSLPAPLACFCGFADNINDAAGIEALTTVRGWPEEAIGALIGDHGFCRPEERPDLPHVTLDTFAASTRIIPNIITMDVEGAELRVLEGAKGILTHNLPLVYVSVHPDFMRAHYSSDAASLFAYMSDLGYASIHLATDHEEHHLFWHLDGRVPADI